MCREPAVGNLSAGQRAERGNTPEQQDTKELIKTCHAAITAFTEGASVRLLSPHQQNPRLMSHFVTLCPFISQPAVSQFEV